MKTIETKYVTPANDVNRLIKYDIYEDERGMRFTRITYYRRDYAPNPIGDNKGIY